jgi:hypothetical protein
MKETKYTILYRVSENILFKIRIQSRIRNDYPDLPEQKTRVRLDLVPQHCKKD